LQGREVACEPPLEVIGTTSGVACRLPHGPRGGHLWWVARMSLPPHAVISQIPIFWIFFIYIYIYIYIIWIFLFIFFLLKVTCVTFLLDWRSNLTISVKFVDEKRLHKVICNFRLPQKPHNYFLYHREYFWFKPTTITNDAIFHKLW
jgi:hypothetical protein